MKADIGQMEFIDSALSDLVTWLEKELGAEFTSTSLYRIGDSGVHGTLPLRGMDLRCRRTGMGKEIEDFVNTYWEYDPTRPEKVCAILHGQGSSLHLHLQVHPNTRRKY